MIFACRSMTTAIGRDTKCGFVRGSQNPVSSGCVGSLHVAGNAARSIFVGRFLAEDESPISHQPDGHQVTLYKKVKPTVARLEHLDKSHLKHQISLIDAEAPLSSIR